MLSGWEDVDEDRSDEVEDIPPHPCSTDIGQHSADRRRSEANEITN
eukprot:CAMPEP_0181216430 /NCGR_PEP_ID=MMETSP1096-20121128/26582_1 /TAXON_ID=156174 ORGANISM="Chrysochromulina ericina, Strain CCMP281" /NCGR_SAMPLE_ID=MMETSP1096 /ASSEMBLY_ACC=CAM_ASM_000453 /LENGTH=45 /DNA_ID= /DNA_START= /DNA_END= /DNA_ORIENTATION=